MSKITDEKIDEIKSWIHSIDADNFDNNDEQSSCSSVVESSIIQTSRSSVCAEELELSEIVEETQFGKYQNVLPQMSNLTFNNVNISNSTNVYLGHIYKVNGSLNINVIHTEEMQQQDDNLLDKKDTQQNKSPITRPACLIFPRYRWLAMDPLGECKQLIKPVHIVVVGYTATTSSTIQARNIGIIRDFQTLNVEAQGFNDIAYNFLIGCDGILYEGRGWSVEGEHTSGYNDKSIGVAFVGYFKRELPTEIALKTCKNLLKRGVAEGHISKDYKLLTSCQVLGDGNLDALYEEFKIWNHFYDTPKS